MGRRIYISGASGAGVSTLGAALAARLGVAHVDVDDYYWYPTEPPFVQARPVLERVSLLRGVLAEGDWVLSGSLDGWGDEVIQGVDWVVFVDTPTALRIERIKARELQCHGERILPGGDMHENHLAFLAWAESYESGSRAGRNRPRHERWLDQLPLPWLRVDGALPSELLLQRVLSAIAG